MNVSKVLLTNTRTDSNNDQKKLEEHLSIYENNPFFHQTQWPFSKSSTGHISPLFAKHRYDTYLYDNPLSTKTGTFPEAKSTSRSLHNYYTMTTDSLKKVRSRLIENSLMDFVVFRSRQSMIFGIFMLRGFIWILLQCHLRKLFDMLNKISLML